MLKQQEIHLRQAGEAAGMKQEFETPQAELAWLKEHRQNLKGFVRVLEIIDEMQDSEARLFSFSQTNALLDRNWLAKHDTRRAACAGALLHWFFSRMSPVNANSEWHFFHGVGCLDRHLGFRYRNYADGYHSVERESESSRILAGIIFDMSGIARWNPASFHYTSPYGGSEWPVPHLDVFRRLAELHPDK